MTSASLNLEFKIIYLFYIVLQIDFKHSYVLLDLTSTLFLSNELIDGCLIFLFKYIFDILGDFLLCVKQHGIQIEFLIFIKQLCSL